MLYHLYEMNRAVMHPVRHALKFQKRFFDSPFNPVGYTTLGKAIVAADELVETATRRYAKPDWGLDSTVIDGATVEIKEEIIWSKPFCNLVHFKRNRAQFPDSCADRIDPRVIVVAPMSGHYATLLRGTVEAFLPDHEVFVTDWLDAREVSLAKGRFDLNTYIDYVIEMLRQIGPGAHIVAVCQPGPPVLSAVALLSEWQDPVVPASLTIMGSPIDPRLSPTVPNKLALEKPYSWFQSRVIYSVPPPNLGSMRRVYPGFIQLMGFMAMNSDRHLFAHRDYFNHLVKGDQDSVLKHRQFYDEYLSVMDLTQEFYLQTIWDVFKEFKLPKGEFYHRGQLVKPAAIDKVALLTVEGENDDISGIGQTQAAHNLCINIPDRMQMDYIQKGVGHYGVFNGRRFCEQIQPLIGKFMRSHCDLDQEREIQKHYSAVID